jgi:hypothetical protein
MLLLAICVPLSTLASTDDPPILPDPAAGSAIAATASLHNPTFDNGDWYEFNGRYGHYQWGCWVPDDDNNKPDQNPLPATLQDWRLWFQNGTDIVETDPEQTYRHSGSEAVQIRPYGSGTQVAGLYQIIYDTTPCLTYRFQMYAQSRPEGSDDRLTALQVGINPGGWYPTLPDFPAVKSFGNTIWGPSSSAYTWYYGPLTVTAEVTNTRTTVWTYGDAKGGRSHRILWDTGSFQEVTPGLIPDPNNPPAATIGSVTAITSTTSATMMWSTAAAALGQVYYRKVSCPSTPISPTTSLTHTVYLPLVSRYVGWSSTALNKTLLTSHSEAISGLQAGCTYEYIVASRGISGGQCVTWVSDKRTFTTAP